MQASPTRHQEVVESLVDWIVGNSFPAGSVLPNEEEIGHRLGVSRTVVREAMRTLAAKGMVVVRRRHGTQVQPTESWSLFDAQVVGWRLKRGVSREFIEDLVQFRLGVEPHAAGLAAANPQFPAEQLRAAYALMTEAVEGGGDYHEADLEFHRIILAGSGNQFLRQLAPLLGNALRISFGLSVLSMESARASLPMHLMLADAIVEKDSQGAIGALSALITSAREDMLIGLSGISGQGRQHEQDHRLSD